MPDDAIDIAGRSCRIAGDPADHYFMTAADNAASLRRLGIIAAAVAPIDGTILDVGANIGLSALTLAAQVPRGRVFAFEASPRTAAYLRRNAEANAPGVIEAVASAVGAEDGVAAFHQHPSFSAGSHVLSAHHASAAGKERVEVPMTTLDTFARARGLIRVDLIKIDVEGFEADALAGAAETIARFRPVILAEMNSFTLIAMRNQNPRAFIEGILAAYAHVSWMDAEGDLHPITLEGLYDFMHTHLVAHALVSDLVFCDDDAWVSRYRALVRWRHLAP